MRSYAQAGQDRFAYEILGRKTYGTFLDVGCHDGVTHSNTFALEQLGWSGMLIDIQHLPGLLRRQNGFLKCDAVTADWKNIFETHFAGEKEIDYLSLDVDDATTPTLVKLMALPMRYRVITIEHDLYRLGAGNATTQRELLAREGYEIMCRDVRVGPGEWGEGGCFEDWWCTHELMTEANRRRFMSFNELGTNIVPDENC